MVTLHDNRFVALDLVPERIPAGDGGLRVEVPHVQPYQLLAPQTQALTGMIIRIRDLGLAVDPIDGDVAPVD
jgi:hypothetical protein